MNGGPTRIPRRPRSAPPHYPPLPTGFALPFTPPSFSLRSRTAGGGPGSWSLPTVVPLTGACGGRSERSVGPSSRGIAPEPGRSFIYKGRLTGDGGSEVERRSLTRNDRQKLETDEVHSRSFCCPFGCSPSSLPLHRFPSSPYSRPEGRGGDPTRGRRQRGRDPTQPRDEESTGNGGRSGYEVRRE